MNLRRLMQNCPSRTKPTRGQSCASQQKFAADGRDGSFASVERSRHVGFTPDSGRMAATQLTDAYAIGTTADAVTGAVIIDSERGALS
jgi:hypothetical protein